MTRRLRQFTARVLVTAMALSLSANLIADTLPDLHPVDYQNQTIENSAQGTSPAPASTGGEQTVSPEQMAEMMKTLKQAKDHQAETEKALKQLEAE